MRRIIYHTGKGLLAVLVLLLAVNACKKEKIDTPEVSLTINSYYPNSGKAGTLVTIEGEGFVPDIEQYTAKIAEASADVIAATETKVVLRIPENAGSGQLSLSINGKTMDVGPYTFQELSIAGLAPANGPAGSQIRIVGEGFGSVSNPVTVYINEKNALVVSVADTLIVAEVPEDAGYGPVQVQVDGKEVTGQNFTYQAIHTIKPLTGGTNTKVTITGVGFETLAEGNSIDFNGKPATVIEASPEQLTVAAPEDVSTGPLSVTINEQKITGPVFTVVGHPVIDAVSPLSGPKNTEMTISGSLFSALPEENQVFINGVQVPIQSATANELKLIVPGGTGSGKIRVVVNDQITEGPVFKDQTLGVLSLTPDNGLAGTTVTINGVGFSTNQSDNKVFFNGIEAVVSSATETSLTVEAPVGITTGPVKVTVDGLEALSPASFRRAGVMTLAGGPASDAFASFAAAIAVDKSGNVFVADRNNRVVKKVTPSGEVSVLKDQTGADIQFGSPAGLAIDQQNNLFVSDQNNNQVLKITPAGEKTVYTSGFSPGHIGIDRAGNLYVAVQGFAAGINKVFAGGNFSKVPGPNWVMMRPGVDPSGNLYYGDMNSNASMGIAYAPAAGGQTISTWAGSFSGGYADGIGQDARFNNVGGIVYDGNGSLLVADRNNYAIRKADIATKTVSTIMKASSGFEDGTLSTAKFGSIEDIAIDSDGNIYVLDANNMAVRKILLK